MYNIKFDLELLSEYIKKPPIFQQGKTQEDFWDNEYISEQMLAAHLNPNWNAASRKKETIESSCQWIIKTLNLNKNSRVLDLGCGPGLYCNKLSEHEMQLTGIDYSRRSINYAKKQARKRKLLIEYIYMNYLDMEYHNEYDLAMMIYCDFGVLSKESSKKLLSKVYKALKNNGYFVFDVWTTSNPELTSSFRKWSFNKDGGFWSPNSYVELIEKQYYESEDVSLRQHIIIEDKNVKVYNLWEKCYTVDSVTKLLTDTGFEIIDVFADLTGRKHDENVSSLRVIAKKK